jgi:hypothetical protein
MQYTILSLLFAATAVTAAPGTPVAPRQSTPTIYAQFFADGGCHGPWLDDDVFVQSSTASDCVNVGITAQYLSANYTGNTATRTRKLNDVIDRTLGMVLMGSSQGLFAAELQ